MPSKPLKEADRVYALIDRQGEFDFCDARPWPANSKALELKSEALSVKQEPNDTVISV
jgi:hypothetical protein